MRDTSDLTPPQRTPIIRTATAGRAASGGAEQSFAVWLFHPFEDGAEQSYAWGWSTPPFEDGAEQSFGPEAWATPFEDGAEQSYNRLYPPCE